MSTHLPRPDAEITGEIDRFRASVPEMQCSLGDICCSSFWKQPDLFLGLCKGGFDFEETPESEVFLQIAFISGVHT